MRSVACRVLLLGVLTGGGMFGMAAGPVYGQPEQGGETNYIDSALPMNQFRLRFDAAYDNNRPDRAEFFYSQYRSQPFTPLSPEGNRGPGKSTQGNGTSLIFVNRGGGNDVFETSGGKVVYNPQANGLSNVETRIDYQDISSLLEVRLFPQFSGFVEVPVRFLNPEINNNTAGLADMNAGFKWAFLADDAQIMTFQLRTYGPTGASSRGLGNDHVSLEPALLYYRQLPDRWGVFGELRDVIPIGGTDFEGNVLRYGIGISYVAHDNCKLRVTPVAEFVGWTVLGGKETATTPLAFNVIDATGDTIVNAKVGVRVSFGENQDCSISYGRALTGDVWYKDILRLEYRLRF
jgi:hypothetical protein